MNKRGFTLIELLGVIMILSIIMMIAIPNITSVLEKNKKETYIADAKKLITQAEYEIRNGNLNKPSTTEILKITLSYLGTRDVSKDPDGNSYNLTDTFVVVVKKDGYLEYYVNLVADTDNGNKGISLVHKENLNKDTKIEKNFTIPNASKIKTITGVNGTIKTNKN